MGILIAGTLGMIHLQMLGSSSTLCDGWSIRCSSQGSVGCVVVVRLRFQLLYRSVTSGEEARRTTGQGTVARA